MRRIVYIILICLSNHSWSQQHFLFGELDTLTHAHRIGGSIDSIDLITGQNTSTLAGGGWNTRANSFDTDFFMKNAGGQQFFSFGEWKKLQFSGLPHLGFAYSFGSKGMQYVQAEFQQVYRKKLMLNVFYEKNTSNGFLRNSDFDHNNVQVQLNKFGKVYSFDLKSSYESSRVSQSGGLQVDTLPELFDLQFLPVNKSLAETKTQRSRIELTNYIDLLKDSTKAFGLFTNHHLKIKKFRYSEQDTLYGIYSVLNYDTLNTYDQHQWSEVANGAGLFYSGKRILLKAQPLISYWNFQNLGRFNDTVELDLKSDISYTGRFFKLNQSLNYNLIGAQNEWSNKFDFGFRKGDFRLSISSNLSSLLPDYYQRYAQGNNYFSIGNNFERQGRSNQKIAVGYERSKFSISGRFGFTQLKNNYWFVDTMWRNDSLQSVSFAQIGLITAASFGVLNIHFNYNYSIFPESLTIIPVHQLFGRIYLKGNLFKAKKMKAYTGVDVAYLSSFQRIGYYSQVAAFDLNNPDVTSEYTSALHFFTGFQIDEFKFFLRVENLNYFWSDRNLQQVRGYPIPSAQFRLGITWDFFN